MMTLSHPGIGSAVAPAAPAIPHRKQIRAWLVPIATRNTPYALWLTAIDIALFALTMSTAILARNALVQVLAALACGFVIGRLFVLGHDACHQSFTPHRRLNRWLGRLVFLPSLTPYSLWEVGHNVVHHGYTNLKGFDFVWEPLSLEEYQALPAWRQALERIYRSGWAPWLYYLVEVWWTRMFFPSRRAMPTRRHVFLWDCALVSVAAVGWIGGLIAAAGATGQSVGWLLTVGFVVPFVFWNGMIGFVVYAHHTHTDIAWYDDKAAWSAAQARLEERLPGSIVVQPFSWAWYTDTARRCKLYDFKRRRWTDFAGQPTSEPRAA